MPRTVRDPPEQVAQEGGLDVAAQAAHADGLDVVGQVLDEVGSGVDVVAGGGEVGGEGGQVSGGELGDAGVGERPVDDDVVDAVDQFGAQVASGSRPGLRRWSGRRPAG